MVVLGIETSCDDTAAAVVDGGRLRSSVVASQLDHEAFGGVVPELASRAHERLLLPTIQRALDESGLEASDLDGIAVTQGPGLIGSLIVGVSLAKTLALGLDIPVVGVHHLDGHIESLFLGDAEPAFPLLVLIVSGGHTQLVHMTSRTERSLLGRTRDDAAGEAFDKVAKMIGLGWPGGPVIDRLAEQGDPAHHHFTRTRLPGYDFSFSGIKTGVLYHLNDMEPEARATYLERHTADLCASFQEAVVDMLVEPLERAMVATGTVRVGLVGGVSANRRLRTRIAGLVEAHGGTFHVPDFRFCMDNAAMIALSGWNRLEAGRMSALDLVAHPSLPFA
jgi:N6-L-threonylcarbamoyladenine synthase